ncbi:MAG: type II toxin-antitoxin system VapC family toxin [Archaeoglobaceae archaeon]
MIVLDASAAVKWFLREKESEEMKLLLEKIISKEFEVHVPELLFLEVANVLRYAKLSEEDVIEGIKALMILDFSVHGFKELFEDAVEIAFEKGLTIYDSVYLALSMKLGAVLVTYDSILLKFGGKKASDLIRL